MFYINYCFDNRNTSISAALRRHIYGSTLVSGAVQMPNKNINLVQRSSQTLKPSAFSPNVQRITYQFLISACKLSCIKQSVNNTFILSFHVLIYRYSKIYSIYAANIIPHAPLHQVGWFFPKICLPFTLQKVVCNSKQKQIVRERAKKLGAYLKYISKFSLEHSSELGFC